MIKNKKFGLALSGGGYRASAYHLGTLRKLNELGLLDKVDVFSTVSGGSIVGTDYVLNKGISGGYSQFEKDHISRLKQSVIGKLLRSFTFFLIALGLIIWLGAIIFFQFTCICWISLILIVAGIWFIISRQFSIFPVSRIIEGIYNKIFFHGKTLSDLPDQPMMAINSTNLETGRPFTFSGNRMGDSTYDFPEKGEPIKFDADHFPVARSVMASSCVPFAFTPVQIAGKFFRNPADVKRVRPALIDGGVYDNQGIHKLNQEKSTYACDVIVVSDAGNKMDNDSRANNVVVLLSRTCNLFMNRIKKFEMTDNLYHNVMLKKKEVAYISLGWDLENCISGFVTNLSQGLVLPEVVSAHNIPQNILNPFNEAEIIKYLEDRTGYNKILARDQGNREVARAVSTNLTALSDKKINALINHSELMTELQVKLYCPTLVG